MNRKEFICKLDEKLKLIRNEYNYTQDKMSEILGISKKTLIQIEKGRSSLGWTTAVALYTLFKNSEVLDITFGGDALDIILELSHEKESKMYQKTMGGKIWWNDIKVSGQYKIQQNIISKCYRIIDGEDRRICFSFDYEYINQRSHELLK